MTPRLITYWCSPLWQICSMLYICDRLNRCAERNTKHFHVNLGIFYMPQIYDMGPTVLHPLRRKPYWRFLRPKILRLQPGLNPRTWVLKASTRTLEHPRRYSPYKSQEIKNTLPMNVHNYFNTKSLLNCILLKDQSFTQSKIWSVHKHSCRQLKEFAQFHGT